MKTSEISKQHTSMQGAKIQVVSVEPRLDMEGNPSLKDGLPKYKVSAVIRSSKNELSVGEFSAVGAAGASLKGAATMSAWEVTEADGWVYADRSGRVRVALSVAAVVEVAGKSGTSG